MDSIALGQFIVMIFMPDMPLIIGGVTALILCIAIIVLFKEVVPEKEIIDNDTNSNSRP